MRILAAFLLAMAAGGAQASSIIVLEPMRESIGPSIVVVGGHKGVTVEEPVGPSITTVANGSQNSPSVTFLSGSVGGPSIIILRDPAATPDVEVVKTSGMRPMPMVIRGGIAGEVFVRQAPAGSSQSDAAAQPTLLDPNDRGTPAKRNALKRQAERLAQEAAEAAENPQPDPSTEPVPQGQ